MTPSMKNNIKNLKDLHAEAQSKIATAEMMHQKHLSDIRKFFAFNRANIINGMNNSIDSLLSKVSRGTRRAERKYASRMKALLPIQMKANSLNAELQSLQDNNFEL